MLLGFSAFGPMLTAADSDFESGIGSWSSLLATLAQSSAQAHTGSNSLKITCAGASAVNVYPASYAIPQGGMSLTLSAWLRAATVARSIILWLIWYDASGNQISISASGGTNDSTSAWTQVTLTATAPTNAASVVPQVIIQNAANTEVHYLDSVTFTLPAMVDVSQYATQQTRTMRGRSRQTDQYNAGSLNFTLRDTTRQFDPSNTAGAYYGGIVPRIPVQVFLAGVQIFGGYVDDISVRYELPNICLVDFSCLDGFNLLANTPLHSFSASSQTAGARIAATLARPEVNYPAYFPAPFTASSRLDTGQTTLQAGTFDQIPALDHLQTCARSEQGYLFVDKTGVLQFYDRYHVNSSSSSVTFSDQGGATTPYVAVTQKSQALLLYNRVTGTRTGGAIQVATNAQSQARYGTRTLPVSSLENNSDGDVNNLVNYICGRYAGQGSGGPNVRLDSVTVELTSLSSGQLASLLALDLTSVVTIQRQPQGSGTPSPISAIEMIDGISFSLDVSASTYTVMFNLATIDERSFLILNDAVLGTLDSGNLLDY